MSFVKPLGSSVEHSLFSCLILHGKYTLALSPPHDNRWRRYHRMLDLVRFRTMVTEKRIPPENFVTIQAGRTEEGLTSHLHTEEEAIAFFEEYLDAQASLLLLR